MRPQFDTLELKNDMVAAAVAVVVGGGLAVLLMARAHGDHLKSVMMLSTVICLTGGLYSVYGAVRLLRPPSASALARANQVQLREEALRREAYLQAAAQFARQAETSAMETRMTGSLKTIRDHAEQGLFTASDAEKGKYLAAIWSMAACDLDDDVDQHSH